jgi:hypothetical protein
MCRSFLVQVTISTGQFFVRKSCNQRNIILIGLWQAEQLSAAHCAGAQGRRDFTG